MIRFFYQEKTINLITPLQINSFKLRNFVTETYKCKVMATEIITMDDLENFKSSLLEDIKEVLLENQKITSSEKREENVWLKSYQIQRMLGISPGTLQNLRINGTLPYTKVGGVIFYDRRELIKVMEMNKRNSL